MVLGLSDSIGTIKKETWSRSPKYGAVVSSSTLTFLWFLPSSTGFCSSFRKKKKKVVLTILTPFFLTAVLLYALTIRRTHICKLFHFSPLKRMCKCEEAKCWVVHWRRIGCSEVILIWPLKQNFDKIDQCTGDTLLSQRQNEYFRGLDTKPSSSFMSDLLLCCRRGWRQRESREMSSLRAWALRVLYSILFHVRFWHKWGGRVDVLWCSGRRWIALSAVYDFCCFYTLWICKQDREKTSFQWVAVERKRNISHLSERDRKILWCLTIGAPYIALVLLFSYIQSSVYVLCMKRKEKKVQIQLHCITWILQGPHGAAPLLNNK